MPRGVALFLFMCAVLAASRTCTPPVGTGGQVQGLDTIAYGICQVYENLHKTNIPQRVEQFEGKVAEMFSDFTKTWQMAKYKNVKTKDLPKIIAALKKKHPLAKSIQGLEPDLLEYADTEEKELTFHYAKDASTAVFGKLLHARAIGREEHDFVIGMFDVDAKHKTHVTLEATLDGKETKYLEKRDTKMIGTEQQKDFQAYAEYHFAKKARDELLPAPEL